MSDFLTLPDDLLAARDCVDMGKDFDPAVLDRAHDRICQLEEQLLKAQGDVNFYKERVDRLRSAIVGHRGQRDWHGGKIQADRTLWQMVADVPWGEPIKGDG